MDSDNNQIKHESFTKEQCIKMKEYLNFLIQFQEEPFCGDRGNLLRNMHLQLGKAKPYRDILMQVAHGWSRPYLTSPLRTKERTNTHLSKKAYHAHGFEFNTEYSKYMFELDLPCCYTDDAKPLRYYVVTIRNEMNPNRINVSICFNNEPNFQPETNFMFEGSSYELSHTPKRPNYEFRNFVSESVKNMGINNEYMKERREDMWYASGFFENKIKRYLPWTLLRIMREWEFIMGVEFLSNQIEYITLLGDKEIYSVGINTVRDATRKEWWTLNRVMTGDVYLLKNEGDFEVIKDSDVVLGYDKGMYCFRNFLPEMSHNMSERAMCSWEDIYSN